MNNLSFLMVFKNPLNFILSTLLSIVILSSCGTTTRTSSLFKSIKKDTTIAAFVSEDMESKIRKGDLLSIKITSLSPVEDALYGSATISSAAKPIAAAAAIEGFYVDKAGNIEMHKLGVMHLEGMTLKQVETKLVKDLTPYLKDVIVAVNFLNHRVTVFGAVGSSQQIQLDKTEKISLIDAIVASGNITNDGDKSNVLIIRDTEKGKQMTHVNLEDHSIFSSQWYYLKPDDIVYVSMLDNKMDVEKVQRRQQLLATVSYVLSIGVLIYSTFFRK